MTPSLLNLRQYLTSAYSDEDLDTFCSDYFRDVYENFTVGMSKAQKIQRQLDYCQRRDQLSNLLANLERDRPEQYRRRFALTVVETRPESPQASEDAPGQADAPPAAPIPTPDEPSRSVTAEPVRPTPPAIITLEKPIRLELVRIPAGEFLMGSDPHKDKDADDDEKPLHRVVLADFYIGKVPVTNAQFEVFVRARGHKTTAEKEGSGWAWTGSKWEQVKGAD